METLKRHVFSWHDFWITRFPMLYIGFPSSTTCSALFSFQFIWICSGRMCLPQQDTWSTFLQPILWFYQHLKMEMEGSCGVGFFSVRNFWKFRLFLWWGNRCAPSPVDKFVYSMLSTLDCTWYRYCPSRVANTVPGSYVVVATYTGKYDSIDYPQTNGSY